MKIMGKAERGEWKLATVCAFQWMYSKTLCVWVETGQTRVCYCVCVAWHKGVSHASGILVKNKQSGLIFSRGAVQTFHSANWRCCDIPVHHPFLSVLSISHVWQPECYCLTVSNLWLTWFQAPLETGLLSSQTGLQLHSIFNWGNQYGLTMLNGEQSSMVQCEVDQKMTLSPRLISLNQNLC